MNLPSTRTYRELEMKLIKGGKEEPVKLIYDPAILPIGDISASSYDMWKGTVIDARGDGVLREHHLNRTRALILGSQYLREVKNEPD